MAVSTEDLATQARARVDDEWPWRTRHPEVGELVTGRLLLLMADKIQPVQWVRLREPETPEDLWWVCQFFIQSAFDAALNRLRYGTSDPHGGQGLQHHPFGQRLRPNYL